MQRRDLTILGLAFVSVLAAAPPPNHVPGRLLAQSRIGANPNSVGTALLRAGAHLQKTIDRINVHVIQVPEPAIDRVSAALMQSGLFNFVEQDEFVQSAAVVTPNDPYFSTQWHLPAIQAPAAWSITKGASNVLIAIIDSGADWKHPDLAPNLVPGWNFLAGTSNTQDTAGHGTSVAGAAAAASNNAVGVTGVSWNNKIMPLQVLDSVTAGSYSNIASAIIYAADHGVRIISISLAGSTPSSALQSAVDYAWNKGAVVFAAAGNSSSTSLNYPAATNNVVAVSATSAGGVFASYSNYGTWIDLSAPGTSIMSTQLGGGYHGTWYGTSFSTPIAAAVGALVLSAKPGLSASALVSLLQKNSDDLGAPGYDPYFGYGQVNAYKAVVAAGRVTVDTTLPTVSITSPANAATVAGTIQIQGTATDNVGVTSIQFLVDNQAVASSSASPFSFSWNTLNYVNGSHTLTVKASDAAGNVGSASVSVTIKNVVVSDTTPPIVTIVTPISGASATTLSGMVQITASATDNVGIAQVSFYIDNSLKCTDTSPSYTCHWNARKTPSGAHILTVKAWDPSGNFSSASTTVYN